MLNITIIIIIIVMFNITIIIIIIVMFNITIIIIIVMLNSKLVSCDFWTVMLNGKLLPCYFWTVSTCYSYVKQLNLSFYWFASYPANKFMRSFFSALSRNRIVWIIESNHGIESFKNCPKLIIRLFSDNSLLKNLYILDFRLPYSLFPMNYASKCHPIEHLKTISD